MFVFLICISGGDILNLKVKYKNLKIKVDLNFGEGNVFSNSSWALEKTMNPNRNV